MQELYLHRDIFASMHISTAALAEQFSRMDLFRSVPAAILLELAEKSIQMDVPAGGLIFQKDEPGHSLYLLLEGAAKVHDGDFTVAQMASGACFGEMALLDEGPRSMSVTANTPTLLARIDREVFFEVLGDSPGVMQKIVSLLTQRLRFQTDQTVAQLRRREEELSRQVEERTAELMRQKEEAELLRIKAELEKQEAEKQRLRAEQSERAEQQFLANMSHEIRTPMNAVMGMTQLLLQKNPREDQLRYLHSINQSSEALLVILNDILDISKIQAGRFELEYTELRVAEIFDNVRTTLQYRAEEKGLALHVECDPDIPPVLIGDPVRLQQILLNLAGNAVKFTEKGSVTLIARLQENNRGRCRLYFEVCDTGIGMTAEQLAVVFDSFRQASSDTTRKYGGTGLGLSISKQLVEMFGGRLEALSTPGVGSVFQFAIELEIGRASGIKTGTLETSAIDGLRGLHILLAEDNAFNRIVAIETLEMTIPGIRVTAVENGQQAFDAMRNGQFDVVLMDIAMPVMDGLEATSLIRSLPPPANAVPIIAFTASVTKKEVDKWLAIGMNACVPKPFKAAELIGALGTVTLPANRPPTALHHTPAPVHTEPHRPVSPTPTRNFELVEQLGGGNPERRRKYLGLYFESAAAGQANITAALEANDPAALRRAVHTLKPQFKLLGMPETAELAQEIETQALDGVAPVAIREKVERLLGEIEQSVKDFEVYLANHNTFL